MAKRIVSFSVLLSLSLSLSLFALDETAANLKSALDDIGATYYQQIDAGFGNFTVGYDKVGSSFSRYLEDEIAAALSGDRYYKLVMKGAVENMDPAFQAKYAEVFGNLNVRALICGRYFDEGAKVRVCLEVVSLQDGTLIGRRDVFVDKGTVPRAVAATPPDADAARETERVLAGAVAAAGGDRGSGLAVHAQADRGNGAVYRDGEKLVVRFFVSRDAYVKLYHIDVNGRTKLIFPNEYHADNQVRANTLVSIPDASYPFTFNLGAPYGTEFIKVVASTTQFSDIEDAFTDLGAVSREVVTRGLTVSGSGERAEALVTYTIVGK